jgi:hypothetical protein
MTNVIEKLIGPMVLPAALVGLSTNIFTGLFPKISQLIGWFSLLLLCVSTILYVTYYISQRIVPKRFANLVYLLDEKGNLATIVHPYHGRVQPPGSRLGYHEGPNEAISRVLLEELGVDPSKVEIWSRTDLKTFGDVELVATPIQVQFERHKQRLGVNAHYDYVYLCRVAGERPSLMSTLHPQWMSLKELEGLRDTDTKRRPFADVIPTFRDILYELENETNWYRLKA